MFKNKSVLRVTLLTICSIAFAFLSAPSAQNKQHEHAPNENDGATPVKEGVLTPRQRVHSKLFSSHERTSKLIDDAKEYGDGGMNRVIGPGLMGESQFGVRATRENSVKKRVCDSDAVITGRVLRKESQLTLNGESIFTDYEAQVDSVGKNDRRRPAEVGDTVIITRQGGTVRVRGLLISVEDRNSPALITGQTYFFFLKRVPATGAYLAQSTALVSDENRKLVQFEERAVDLLIDSDVSMELAEVRAAALVCGPGSNK